MAGQSRIAVFASVKHCYSQKNTIARARSGRHALRQRNELYTPFECNYALRFPVLAHDEGGGVLGQFD